MGTLAKLDRPARSILLWDKSVKNEILLAKGDTLLGDTLRSTVAEMVVQALLSPSCVSDFSVVNADGASPSESEIRSRLVSLK